MIKTITAQSDFRLSNACEIIAEHWEELKSGVCLNLNLAQVGYLDPAIVALFILVENYFPNKFKVVNPNELADKIIKRVAGKEPRGTIFPAQKVLGCLNGSMLENLKFWISYISRKFYEAPRNSSADFVELASVELINNILDHSEAEHGGVIVAASFAKRKHFELTVIDFGDTIPGTLEEYYGGSRKIYFDCCPSCSGRCKENSRIRHRFLTHQAARIVTFGRWNFSRNESQPRPRTCSR